MPNARAQAGDHAARVIFAASRSRVQHQGSPLTTTTRSLSSRSARWDRRRRS